MKLLVMNKSYIHIGDLVARSFFSGNVTKQLTCGEQFFDRFGRNVRKSCLAITKE